MISGYLPICGFVPNHRAPKINLAWCRSKLRVVKAIVSQFSRLITLWLLRIISLNTIEAIGKVTQDMKWSSESAIKTLYKHSNYLSGRSVPLWTLKCSLTQLDYGEIVEKFVRNMRTETLRATFASAKTKHWKRKIKGMRYSRDICYPTRWAASRNTSIIPCFVI